MTSIIALAGLGEMGAAIGRRIVDSGGQVFTSLEGRSSASICRARSAGIETGDVNVVIERSDIYLSIVPPAAAEEVADRYIANAATATRVPTFIDCNAIAPVRVEKIAARFAAAGLLFADGSIIGGPPDRTGYGPRIYLSGNIRDGALMLSRLGLEVRHISQVPGDASALKLSYAGLTKGLQALASGVIAGAARADLLEHLVDEMRDSLPGLYAFLAKSMPKMPRKAHRWDYEMAEIATFLRHEEGAAMMFDGAAMQYRDVARRQVEDAPALPGTISRFCNPIIDVGLKP